MAQTISILGSTGSIGRQTLEVCEHLGIRVACLTARQQLTLLFEQAKKFKPELLVLEDPSQADKLRDLCAQEGLRCQVKHGQEGLKAAASWAGTDTVVAAMVGMAGLEPVIAALEAGKDVALANKETLVAGGSLVMNLARAKACRILPVDSEHSAIWQCLRAGKEDELEKIFLTCSGGPFRGKTREELKSVSQKEALAHPTWKMGGKISIDSATLMNKGLELIEACHLFSCSEEQVEIVVHPESIIHSMVGFCDHSVIAQLGFPDMRLPIQLALTWPKRLPSLERAFDPFSEEASTLHFERADQETFRAIELARAASRDGRCLPIVLNAANEVAVHYFLNGKLSFLGITDITEQVMVKFSGSSADVTADLAAILDIDRKARHVAEELCELWVN